MEEDQKDHVEKDQEDHVEEDQVNVLVEWGLRNIWGMGIESMMYLEAGRVRVATDEVD